MTQNEYSGKFDLYPWMITAGWSAIAGYGLDLLFLNIILPYDLIGNILRLPAGILTGFALIAAFDCMKDAFSQFKEVKSCH